MKVNEIITEARKRKKVVLSKKEIATLHAECSQFLSASTVPLFRGDSETSKLTKRIIRTDRRPLDSSTADTAVFNYAFEKRHKVPYIRNRVSFATTSIESADEYGISISLVFPVNGTKYVRGKGIHDLYNDKFQSSGSVSRVIDEYADSNDRTTIEVSNILWSIPSNGKVTVDQVDAMFKKHPRFLQMLIIEYRDIVSHYHIFNQWTPTLNRSSEEIMMFDVPYFYSLPTHLLPLRSSHQLFVGKDRMVMPRHNFEAALLLFTAVKNGQEVYYYED